MGDDGTITIKEFPIHTVKQSCSWVVIGAPGTGKTTFIKDLVYWNKQKYAVGRVWCGTEDTQGAYGLCFHPLYITNEYKEDEHENFAIRQKMCTKTGSADTTGAVVIIDDCNIDKKIFKTKIMNAQIKNGTQWWNNMFIIGSHYVFDMPPAIRKCISYVAIFKENSVEERKKLFQNFAIGCTFSQFCDLMDQITGDHTCLIFSKFSDSNKMEDSVFYYKARCICPKGKKNPSCKLHGPWKFGCKEYQQWGADRYNPKYTDTY